MGHTGQKLLPEVVWINRDSGPACSCLLLSWLVRLSCYKWIFVFNMDSHSHTSTMEPTPPASIAFSHSSGSLRKAHHNILRTSTYCIYVLLWPVLSFIHGDAKVFGVWRCFIALYKILERPVMQISLLNLLPKVNHTKSKWFSFPQGLLRFTLCLKNKLLQNCSLFNFISF